jgi:hypothetical protein
MEKNGTSASPATARASSVLPVPGWPDGSTPCGICAPSLRYRSGLRRKSTISVTSFLTSSMPATSANVVRLADPGSYRLALDLPMPKPPIPPRALAPPLRAHQASRPPNSRAGPNHSSSSSHSGVPCCTGLAFTVTPLASSFPKRSSLAKLGRSVVNCSTGSVLPGAAA